MKKIKFEDYQRLCYSRAYHEARRHGNIHKVDDYISASHEVFVKALNSYDEKKGAFSTHLHTRLRNLHRYATMSYNQRELKETASEYQAMSRISQSVSTLMLNQEKLSCIAKQILDGIMAGEFMSNRTPMSENKIYIKTSFTHPQIRSAVEELQSWYDGNVLTGVC